MKQLLTKIVKRKQIAPCFRSVDELIQYSLNKPFSFSIDVVDGCNLRCIDCPRGVYFQQNTYHPMAVQDFEQLLNKLISECPCQKIELYNWSEPFLHQKLDIIVKLVKLHDIKCILSSNLSFHNDALLESVLSYSPTILVSVSGFTQEVHERYHQGSHIDQVRRNLQHIAALRGNSRHSSKIEIRCLEFTDNQRDQQLWREFCHQYGFLYSSLTAYPSEVTTIQSANRLIYPPEFEQYAETTTVKRSFLRIPLLTSCPLHNTIPIDASLDVYLCCIYWNRKEYKIGNILDLTLGDIQRKRLLHHDCSHCTVFRKCSEETTNV